MSNESTTVVSSFGCTIPAIITSSKNIAVKSLSQEEIARVGQKIWHNECGGRVDQLIYWKEGEQWPSVGIGHFIWPPETYQGAFKEGEFHTLLSYFEKEGVQIPKWASKYSPWENEDDFNKDIRGRQELQELMLATIRLQADFIVSRLYDTLPKIVVGLKKKESSRFISNTNELLSSSNGTFALIDYLNFKGAGTAAHEHYQGHRWGLLQVVIEMKNRGDPVDRFIASAKRVLQRRVTHAASHRDEGRWIPGWFARLDRYRAG